MVDDERRERERDERPRPARPERTGPLGSIAGTDAGALGTGGTQRLDSPRASVEESEKPAPAHAQERPATEAKPWFTSLAFNSDQAGVMADQPPLEGWAEDDPRRDEEDEGGEESG